MEHQTDFTSSPFDTIRREDEQGNEYWSARELYKILGYTEWRHFNNTVIKRARKACAENGQGVSEHFVDTYKMSSTGQGGKRKTADVHLSRYACYLTVMNGDPNMPVVAMGQTYFASQTRRQELADQIAALPEDQRRIVYRSDMSVRNRVLNDAAKGAGVTSPGDFATFTNHGYHGLYGGETENDIHARKRLAPEEHILDFMGSEELADNIFRAAQTDAKLKREQIKGKE